MRPRCSYANVVATLALFLALSTGGAVAASKLIDGKQLKPGTVRAKQLARNAIVGSRVKDGSLTAADFKAGSVPAGALGPAGPRGADGAKGADGTKGADGARGASAWDPIPSGQTVTGGWNIDTTSGTANLSDAVFVQLPGRVTAALPDQSVNFAADATAVTDDDDATCTGTVQAPTAPAGKVCLYKAVFGASATTLTGYGPYAASMNGFLIAIGATADDVDVYAAGSWAYTAP